MSEKYTKKQHYIPRMMLKKWSSDGKTLCGVDKVEHEKEIYGINNICVENDLYEIKTENGYVNRNFLEIKMSEIECFFKDFLEELERKVMYIANENSCKIFLSDKEIFFIMFWITFLFSRSPKIVNRIKELTHELNLEDHNALQEIVINSVLAYPLSFTIKHMDRICMEFKVSEKAEFWLSDSMMEWDFDKGYQVIPLSPKLAVRVRLDRRRLDDYFFVSKTDGDEIEKINYHTYRRAERFVFMPS